MRAGYTNGTNIFLFTSGINIQLRQICDVRALWRILKSRERARRNDFTPNLRTNNPIRSPLELTTTREFFVAPHKIH